MLHSIPRYAAPYCYRSPEQELAFSCSSDRAFTFRSRFVDTVRGRSPMQAVGLRHHDGSHGIDSDGDDPRDSKVEECPSLAFLARLEAERASLASDSSAGSDEPSSAPSHIGPSASTWPLRLPQRHRIEVSERKEDSVCVRHGDGKRSNAAFVVRARQVSLLPSPPSPPHTAPGYPPHPVRPPPVTARTFPHRPPADCATVGPEALHRKAAAETLKTSDFSP